MLNHDDLTWLARQLSATAELLGQELKPNAAAMLAEDLAVFDRNTLAAALQRVRTEHTGRLTLKVILDRIDELAGRPAANEAWALASQALDERMTIVWTGEMSDAWSVARPLAASGDMVGARMAFISSYERLVRTARDERRLPRTWVSLGWDAEGRAAAVEKALALGYVSPQQAQQMLPNQQPSIAFNPVALLTGRVEAAAGASPETRKRLAELRAELAGRQEREARASAEAARAEAKQFALRKKKAQQMVNERIAEEAAKEVRRAND